jgi:hypothetical protein
MSLLDLGAGTGHFISVAWREMCNLVAGGRRLKVGLHLVDVSGPCAGRSFGLTGASEIFRHVEWTSADYRMLLDDDDWLAYSGPFGRVFICRLLGNASNIVIEKMDAAKSLNNTDMDNCSPCKCLAPGRQPGGLEQLRVRTVRRPIQDGVFMPQFSLSDYFSAMRSFISNDVDSVSSDASYLPVRRFNPAALTTRSGRSVIAQLVKVASAIVIEDTDLAPEDLADHRRHFGLDGSAAVNFVGDGFNTEVHHYVITAPRVADRLAGNRLW